MAHLVTMKRGEPMKFEKIKAEDVDAQAELATEEKVAGANVPDVPGKSDEKAHPKKK